MQRTLFSMEAQSEKGQDEAEAENPNIGLPLEMINYVLSFATRDSFRYFSGTCRFFYSSVDNSRIYNKLPAPLLNFRCHSSKEFFPIQTQSDKFFPHFSHILQLNNSQLIAATKKMNWAILKSLYGKYRVGNNCLP
jgi:hypothetical protein